MLTKFLRDESGAVTVDFVVLTAGIVGVGLASVSVVSVGLDQLANNVSASLSGMNTPGSTPRPGMTELVSNSFSDGQRGDWIGGLLQNFREFGDVLVVESGEFASIDLDFPDGAEEGLLTFDVIAGDSIDYESAFFFVDGELVVDLMAGRIIDGVPIRDRNPGEWLAGGSVGFDAVIPAVEGITVTTQSVVSSDDLGASPQFMDAITRVTVRLDNPPPSVTFAATSNYDESLENEFFAIDNFSSSYR